jgi:uncharacterized DUF497 family protein
MDDDFEWDEAKASFNLRKHGVSFEEAASVLEDALALTAFDSSHSDDEERFATLGMSDQGRIIVVAHTDRGDRVRIINARKATNRERKAYENARLG